MGFSRIAPGKLARHERWRGRCELVCLGLRRATRSFYFDRYSVRMKLSPENLREQGVLLDFCMMRAGWEGGEAMSLSIAWRNTLMLKVKQARPVCKMLS